MNRITISGEISSWGYSARWLRGELKGMSGDLEIELSSFGGDVFEGVDMYNELRKYSKEKGKVTTVVTAKAMSIASLIYLAGDVRKAYSNATIMIHKAWTWMAGNADELLKEAKVLDSIDNVLVNEYNKYMPEEKEAIKDIMKEEGWYIGQEEMATTNFVDEFIDSNEDSQELAFAKKAFANSVDSFKAKAKEENAKPNLDIAAKVIQDMGGANTAMPSDNVKLVNSTKGATMEFNEENFNTLLEENKVLNANKQTMATRLNTATTQVEELQAALDTKDAEMSALNKDMDAKLSEAKTDLAARVQEGMSYALSSETITSMMKAESPEASTAIAMDAKESNGATQSVKDDEPKESAMLAWAEKNKGSIR